MTKIIILVTAVFLLFYNLSSPMLWQDEGEVALIARNINKFKLPVAWDDNYLITQEEGQDSTLIGNNRLWSWNTWLPYYLVAVSFQLFGQSTLAARLPFALAGVGTLVISYLLAKKSGIRPVLCLLVLATNALFYLYGRQARYYSLSMFFPLAALYFYLSRRFFLYFLSLVGSFHSNFALALGFNLPIILLSLRNKWTLLFIVQSTLWLWQFHPPSRNWDGVRMVVTKLTSYLNIINSFYFPLVFAPLILMFRRNKIFVILVLGVITHLIVISFSLRLGQRYLVTLIPVFSILIAAVFSKLWEKNKLIFLPLFLVAIFSNVFFVFSEKVFHPSTLLTKPTVRYFFTDFVKSLPQYYPGPLEGINKYLTDEKITDPNTEIYTDYEVNSLKFYFPGLKIVSHPSESVTYWIPRYNWGQLRELTSCQKELVKRNAEKVVLDNFDTQWENMPDITYHQFAIDKATPRVTIYKVNKKIDWKQCD